MADPFRLVVIGDSTAASVGAADVSIAGLVADCIGTKLGRPVEVTNLAVNGARTASVVTRQLPNTPAADLVMIGLGANEVTRPVLGARRLARLQRETVTLLRGLRQRQTNVPVIHTGSPPMDTIPRIPRQLRRTVYRRVQRVNDAIRAACQQENAAFVEMADETRAVFRRDGPELFSADRYHVNDAGYRLCAAPICRAAHALVSP